MSSTPNVWMMRVSGWLSMVMVVASGLPVSAQAPLLLDGFDAPTPAGTGVAFGAPSASTSTVMLRAFAPSILGGVREAWFSVYGNDLNSICALAVGDGRMSAAQGTGAIADIVATYGAFTRPNGPNVGGPLLGLDLSNYKGIQLDFSGAEDGMNINVVYYTSAPLTPSEPQYYASSGINIAPPVLGGPVSFVLDFDREGAFNWFQVDGVVLEINVSGPTPSTSYTLDALTFVAAGK